MSWLPKGFGDRLRLFRRRKRLTQVQLESQTRIPTYLIGRLENEKERPTREQLATLAQALDVSVIALLGNNEHMVKTRDRVYQHDPDRGCGQCRFRYHDFGWGYYMCLAMPKTTPIPDTRISGREMEPDAVAPVNCPLREGAIIIENPRLVKKRGYTKRS